MPVDYLINGARTQWQRWSRRLTNLARLPPAPGVPVMVDAYGWELSSELTEIHDTWTYDPDTDAWTITGTDVTIDATETLTVQADDLTITAQSTTASLVAATTAEVDGGVTAAITSGSTTATAFVAAYAGAYAVMNAPSGGDLIFYENLSEVGRYDGGDNAWYFEGNIDGQAFEITQALDDTSADCLDLTLTSSAPGNAAWWVRCYYDSRVSFAGGLRFSGGGSFGIYTSSDAAIKDNIRPLPPAAALAQICKMRVRRYRRIGAPRDEIGFVLQEVREDWPELAETPEQVAAESERDRQRAARQVARCAARITQIDALLADATPAQALGLREQRAALERRRARAQRHAEAPDRPGCIATHEVPYALVGAVQALRAEIADLRARLAALEAR